MELEVELECSLVYQGGDCAWEKGKKHEKKGLGVGWRAQHEGLVSWTCRPGVDELGMRGQVDCAR